MAPAGVTVVSIGSTEQGFHPGHRPPPGETETKSKATCLDNHRRKKLSPVEESVAYYRSSTQPC